MIKSLIDEHEELLSSMDWSFLPTEKSKEPWPETRHAILLGSSVIVQYDWNCYLWHLIFCCVFLFICIYGLVFMFSAYKFLTKDIRVFKCEILLKMLNSGHCQKKKKRRRNMIAILCLVNVFSELCLKDILRWNLYTCTGKRLIRSFPTTFLREAV